MEKGKTIWDLFKEKTGIHYYLFEQNCEKNFFKIYHNPLTSEEKKIMSLDNLEGLFICKGSLFDNSGKYVGANFFPFISDMQAFARDNDGEFLHFSSIVLNHKFEGEKTNWYEKFKKEFFPF